MGDEFPDPSIVHPLPSFDRVCFIKNTVKNPNIVVGDFTYYDDPNGATEFERNVLYHYDFVGDKLIIGRFCAIATSVRFIMNGANHRLDMFSTFPFAIFGPPWTERLSGQPVGAPSKGDTHIGNDVWLGYGATIMPGVTIGDGAIIASQSVVVGDVPPYALYGGNPARLLRMRFDAATIECLRDIAWWAWEYAQMTEHLPAIASADLEALRQANRQVKGLNP